MNITDLERRIEPFSNSEKQTHSISEVVEEVRNLLINKNKSYEGSAFKDISFSGKIIKAEDSIDCRIVDKIKRLQSNSPDFNGEDAELDLLGYLILKRAVKLYKGLK